MRQLARLGNVAALGLLVSVALLADTWAPRTSALTQNATACIPCRGNSEKPSTSISTKR